MSDDKNAKDAWLERVRQSYRETPGPRPEAKQRLEQALDSMPQPGRGKRSALRVWAMAAGIVAVVFAGALIIGRSSGRSPSLQRAGGEASDSVQVVRFALSAPRASRVSVVGDFNGWDEAAAPMRRQGAGVWTISLSVSHGRHVYAFLVDRDHWVSDPEAPLAPEDGFGVSNSVIVVGSPGGT